MDGREYMWIGRGHFHHGYIMFFFFSHVVRDVLDDVTQSVTDALWVTL